VEESTPRADRGRTPRFAPAADYAAGIAGVAVLTIACWLLTPLTGYAAIALIYLLGVLLSGIVLRRGPVLLVAALSALCWNFLFIPPLFTLHIGKVQDALMFLTYFLVAIAIGSLTSRLRAREQAEREREHRATALYQFAQKIAAAPLLETACATATAEIRKVFSIDPIVVLHASEESRPTSSLNGEVISLPIKRFETTFGVLKIRKREHAKLTSVDRELLGAFTDELASLVERDRLMQIAAKAQLSYQAERLRKTLLDCVSHELKTPLAAIRAASQQLLNAVGEPGHDDLSRQLAREVESGSQRLNRVVNNLLDMTRLESGVIEPKLEWCEVRELLQAALQSEREAVASRDVRITVPDELPLALMDHSLIEQAIAKLVANAANYSPAGSPIELSAVYAGSGLAIAVADRGPGLPNGAAEKVFEKFFRAKGSATGGLGLGLSIARGFVEAHGGTLTARTREGGGALFEISLPVRVTDPLSFQSGS